MSLQNAFSLAARQIGLNEREQGAAIKDYLTTGGQNLDPQTAAWCAAFVNSTLEQSGYKGTGSNLARSFLDWGQAVDDPEQGDLAVFWRDNPEGPYGHVGFFDGYNADGTIRVLGGNQGDAVSVANYDPSRLLGFRRAEQPSQNAFANAGTPLMPQMDCNAFRPTLTRLDPAAFQQNTNAFARL